MDFKTATDRAAGARITLEDVANAAGASHNAIRRARLEKNGDSYRNPPMGWELALARLIRERIGTLMALAEELEAHD
jgi:hypothetical protein